MPNFVFCCSGLNSAHCLGKAAIKNVSNHQRMRSLHCYYAIMRKDGQPQTLEWQRPSPDWASCDTGCIVGGDIHALSTGYEHTTVNC